MITYRPLDVVPEGHTGYTPCPWCRRNMLREHNNTSGVLIFCCHCWRAERYMRQVARHNDAVRAQAIQDEWAIASREDDFATYTDALLELHARRANQEVTRWKGS